MEPQTASIAETDGSCGPTAKKRARADLHDGHNLPENSSSMVAPEVVDVDSAGCSSTLHSSPAQTAAAAVSRSPPTAPRASSKLDPTAETSASTSSHHPSLGVSSFSYPPDQRRMKQPTLAQYGMVSDTAALKKELEDLRKELLNRDEQLEDATARIAEIETEVARRDAQMVGMHEEFCLSQAKLERFREVMHEEMARAAKQGRAEARRVLHQKHFELGQIGTWGPNGREVWVEGNIMRDLIIQLDEVKRQRDMAEGRKKAAQLTLKQLTRQERDREDSAADVGAPENLLTAQMEVQLHTAEHAALSTTVVSIEQRKAEVENEKKAFLKEIRRVTDEDASEFLTVPTIGETGRYVLMHLLGKGGFSEVWKAFDLAEGCFVACKIHRVNKDWPAHTRSHYLRHAERELEIMRSLDHPHLTRLFNVFQHSDSMFVSVMEFSKGMDLDTYLKRYGSMRETEARLVLLQMVAALRHLANQENPIIHYDLKPANILLDSDDPGVFEIKITDFGLSKIVGPNREGPHNDPSIELTSQGTGTYWYLPPECFETSATPRISTKVDIWSVGVIFYQMLYGRRPFAEGESQRNIWQNKLIISSARTLSFPDAPRVSDEAKELISHCLAFNANERYDVFQLSHDPYLYRPGRRVRPRSTAPANTLPSNATLAQAVAGDARDLFSPTAENPP